MNDNANVMIAAAQALRARETAAVAGFWTGVAAWLEETATQLNALPHNELSGREDFDRAIHVAQTVLYPLAGQERVA